MLKLLSDENFHGDVLRGLFRRSPGLDLVRAQDVGLLGADDETILEWAAGHDRILLTHDQETMPDFAFDRVRAGQPMPGVWLVSFAMSKRDAIEQLLLAIECLEAADSQDRVHRFPI